MRARLLIFLVVAALLASCRGQEAAPLPQTPAPDSGPAPAATAPASAPTLLPETASTPSDGEAFTPTLTRLTEPGCCVGATWSASGDQVLFIDRPQPGAPTGIYGVSAIGGPVTLISERVGTFSPDGRYLLTVNTLRQPVIEKLADGSVAVIRNRGRQVIFSPSSLRLAWSEVDDAPVISNRRVTISVAEIDGADARVVATVVGGGIVGWLDDNHLLLTGREPGSPVQDASLVSLSVVDGARVELARSARVRNALPAPGGAWVFYAIALDPDRPEDNGLWVVSADGSQRRRLEVVGSAQWRDGSHLLVVPLEMGAPAHRLVQIDAATEELTALTDPARFPFRIMAGEWRVSPAGDRVAFLNAEDGALWAFDLPPLEPADSSE